jgi:hypothetical protein
MDVNAAARPALVSNAARKMDVFVFLTFSLPIFWSGEAGVYRAGGRDRPVVRLHAVMLQAMAAPPSFCLHR